MDSQRKAFVELTNRIATRDRSVDLDKREASAPLSSTERKFYLAATDLIPTDGIVKQTSDKITAGARTDVDKARAIYEWVVDNSFRRALDARLRHRRRRRHAEIGRPRRQMRRSERAVRRTFTRGWPACTGRLAYASRLRNSATRASARIPTRSPRRNIAAPKFWLDGHGWTPMDPADVRKVVLEEPPGNLAVGDAKVPAARKTLFGVGRQLVCL